MGTTVSQHTTLLLSYQPYSLCPRGFMDLFLSALFLPLPATFSCMCFYLCVFLKMKLAWGFLLGNGMSWTWKDLVAAPHRDQTQCRRTECFPTGSMSCFVNFTSFFCKCVSPFGRGHYLCEWNWARGCIFLLFFPAALLGSDNLVLSSTGLVASRVTATWCPGVGMARFCTHTPVMGTWGGAPAHILHVLASTDLCAVWRPDG